MVMHSSTRAILELTEQREALIIEASSRRFVPFGDGDIAQAAQSRRHSLDIAPRTSPIEQVLIERASGRQIAKVLGDVGGPRDPACPSTHVPACGIPVRIRRRRLRISVMADTSLRRTS
jgi:hypothetical protein